MNGGVAVGTNVTSTLLEKVNKVLHEHVAKGYARLTYHFGQDQVRAKPILPAGNFSK